MRFPSPATIAAFALAMGTAVAQDDLRDRVQLENGKELRGRIAAPFEPGDLMLHQGGRRVRVPRADIASIDRVGDRVHEFLDRRRSMRDNVRARWILVEWARSRELENLARLQAMLLALDNDDERAHTLLGHKLRNKVWLWEHDGKWYGKDQLAAQILRTPILLAGERFAVRTDGDLRAAILALLDLERMGDFFYATFGNDLRLTETLRPIEVFVHRDATAFPRWGFRPVPFYVPEPHGDVAHTFYAGGSPRPRQLFFAGCHGLLYRSLIGSVSLRDDRDRVCPWLEIGISLYVESCLAGELGEAMPGEPRQQDLQALQALARDFRLTNLLHLPMYGGFYLMDDTPTAVNWAAASMFVQYLLRPDNVPNTRSAFLSYVRSSLGDRRGDSSSLFDQVMGRRVEDFDAPFKLWLEKVAAH